MRNKWEKIENVWENERDLKEKTRKDKDMSAYTSDRMPDRMPGCISIRLVDRMPAEYASDRIWWECGIYVKYNAR